jgi:hypothetical protein
LQQIDAAFDHLRWGRSPRVAHDDEIERLLEQREVARVAQQLPGGVWGIDRDVGLHGARRDRSCLREELAALGEHEVEPNDDRHQLLAVTLEGSDPGERAQATVLGRALGLNDRDPARVRPDAASLAHDHRTRVGLPSIDEKVG